MELWKLFNFGNMCSTYPFLMKQGVLSPYCFQQDKWVFNTVIKFHSSSAIMIPASTGPNRDSISFPSFTIKRKIKTFSTIYLSYFLVILLSVSLFLLMLLIIMSTVVSMRTSVKSDTSSSYTNWWLDAVFFGLIKLVKSSVWWIIFSIDDIFTKYFTRWYEAVLIFEILGRSGS